MIPNNNKKTRPTRYWWSKRGSIFKIANNNAASFMIVGPISLCYLFFLNQPQIEYYTTLLFLSQENLVALWGMRPSNVVFCSDFMAHWARALALCNYIVFQNIIHKLLFAPISSCMIAYFLHQTPIFYTQICMIMLK